MSSTTTRPEATPTADPVTDRPDATGAGAPLEPTPPQRWRPRLLLAVRRAVAVAVLLAVWETLSRLQVIDPFSASSPSEVWSVLVGLFADGSILPHIQATFTAALLGLVIGILVGTILGAIAGLVRPVAELIEPVMVVLSAVPRVIFAPLLIIWLGIGIGSKVALSFLLVAVLVFFAVYGGIQDTDQRLVDRIRTFGGSTRVLLREVYVPSISGRVLGQLKIAVGFAFTGAVVGEFVASSRGLGYMLMFAQSQYNAALVFALIVLVMVFVLVLFALTGLVERRALRWRQR